MKLPGLLNNTVMLNPEKYGTQLAFFIKHQAEGISLQALKYFK